MNHNENRAHLENIREELEAIYNGTAESNEDGEPMNFYDWINAEVLDYEYTVSASGYILGYRFFVTLGPNIWIDTRNNEIALAWGSERDSLWLPGEIAEEINVCMEEVRA